MYIYKSVLIEGFWFNICFLWMLFDKNCINAIFGSIFFIITMLYLQYKLYTIFNRKLICNICWKFGWKIILKNNFVKLIIWLKILNECIFQLSNLLERPLTLQKNEWKLLFHIIHDKPRLVIKSSRGFMIDS